MACILAVPLEGGICRPPASLLHVQETTTMAEDVVSGSSMAEVVQGHVLETPLRHGSLERRAHFQMRLAPERPGSTGEITGLEAGGGIL